MGRDEKFLPKGTQIFVCSENNTEDCFEEDHRYSLLRRNPAHKKKKSDAILTNVTFMLFHFLLNFKEDFLINQRNSS